MKAAVVTRYGPPEVVEIRTLADPTPGPGEIVIRVKASAVTSGDWRLRSGTVPRGFGLPMRLVLGWRGPRRNVLGVEMAGVVVDLGQGVNRFARGDRVFAIDGTRMGGHGERAVLKESGAVARIDDNVSYESAAALAFGGTTALHFLRDKGGIKTGDRVLINGASGAVGSAAVQLAHHFGAHVTGVTSTRNAELIRRMGADAVIDYQSTDFATRGESYDLVLDTVGNCPYSRARPILAEGGRLLLVATDLAGTVGALLRPRRDGGRRIVAGIAAERAKALEFLMQLAAQGSLTPHIDRRFPLAKIRDAHALVESRRKRGHVLVTME